MLSWRTARRTSGITTALVVTVGLLLPTSAHAAGTEVTGRAPGVVPAPAPAAPVDVTTTKIPTVAAPAPTPVPGTAPDAPSTSKIVAELPKTTTDGFRMVGVTWAAGPATGVQVEVRTRTSGAWSDWTTLDVDDDDEGGIPGTEPLWVGDADGVAARVTALSGTPQDVSIATIDPGTSGAPAEATNAVWAGTADGVAISTNAAATTDGAPGYTPMPTIISRSAWGAAGGTPCDSPISGDRTRGAVVHHTAGTNSYTAAQSASIVRATQAYHMKSRKWCDIGYNFLVDKYGQIFEGRRGGIDRAVRAAHSGNGPVNTYTMGVSMMGNYDEVKPPAALKDSMVKLIGWRLGTNYLRAKGTYSLGGKTLNMIAGHRDVVSTGCPGRYGYAWLSESGGLRDRVAAYIASYSTPIKSLYTTLGATATGPIFIGEAKSAGGSRLRAKLMDLYSRGAETTAHFVSGAIRAEYDRNGSRTGALGYPTSDPVAIAGAVRQLFDGGRVYQVSGSATAYAVQGDIAAAYAGLGETGGQLGVPTSSTTVAGGVARVNFAKGYITSTAATGRTIAYTSTGAVLSEGGAGGADRPATVGKITVKAGQHSARLSWPAVAGATGYDVCLYAARTSTSCTRWVTGVTSATALVTKLKPTKDTDYYAKVRAVSGSLKGAFSSLKGFNLSATAPVAMSLQSTTAAPEPPATSSANSVTVPSSGQIALQGHGYGHGIGMSQYGAQGAARQGVTYDAILSTYYPGTAIAKRSGSIRVLISQDTSDAVDVQAASGLRFRKLVGSYSASLPTSVGGAKVKTWRIVRVSSRPTQSTLQYRTTGGYRVYKSIRWTGDGQFEGPARIGLVLPGGSVVRYRGAIRSAVPSKGSTARDTVNVLPIEHYVRGVIAAEMPAGWAPEALKAQAVAARTYGVRSLAPSRYYDICSTTACQVYGGASRETASTDAAARATSGQYVTYQGVAALTQFSSSSGGRTSAGSQPYLVATADPYDGWPGNANHDWTTTVSAATIQKAYPGIGTLRKLAVTKRTGGGSWGGRVGSVDLVGTRSTMTISGDDARWAFGLKSNWFGFES
ncbi:MAG: hypothetical protein JWM93_1024 [Frankiales bacterium]|nr:hypothetical protein [Frankiales bacterium]